MKKEEKRKGPLLKWPWNIVAYVLAGIALSFALSPLFGIPLVVWYARHQQKKYPGMADGGYCMARTHGLLKAMPWGILFLALGCGMLWVVWYDNTYQMGLNQTKPEKIGFIACGAFLLLLGAFLIYISVRNSFFPEKSAVAESIRSQLPYPEEAPPVSELFAMVDKDLEENGRTFGRIIIGEQWVLGDHVNYIPRIRGVFGRDEIVTHYRNNKATSAREVELYIVDDRNQVMYSDVQKPDELKMILECLKLRAPYAYFGDYNEMSRFRGASDEEKEKREREFRRRQTDQQLQSFRRPSEREQRVILSSYEISATSRVDEKVLQKILSGEHRREGLALTAGKPLLFEGVQYGAMWCFPDKPEGTQLLLEEYVPGAGKDTDRKALARWTHNDRETIRILMTWAEGKIDEPGQWETGHLEQWGSIDLNFCAREKEDNAAGRVHPGELRLVSASGVGQNHYTFTREDVRLAAESIVDQSCKMVRCIKKGGYLIMSVHNGDENDRRCTVTVSRPVDGKLRFFEIKCTHRQAAEWFLAFYDGNFSPQWQEWKDVTRKITQ